MSRKKAHNLLTAMVANQRGEIFELDGYAAVGSDGPVHDRLTTENTVVLPHGSELMYLPQRQPILFNMQNRCIQTLSENPYAPREPVYPVAAFNSPGYVITHTSAYSEAADAQYLPLFSYGAVGWHGGQFRSAVSQVDSEPRQDLRRMPVEMVREGIKEIRGQIPENRLRAHLENCALKYGCPAGKNFFLGRYEAPLPTATSCNAQCLGCLSRQTDGRMPCSQERIEFTPSAEEIAEVALIHIGRVKKAVVSFGQGCEGDPLLTADTIAKAIRMIRETTDQGTINMNTNGSIPSNIKLILDSGIDSLRISINSVRDACYAAYFRPKNYAFQDVLQSIDLALANNVHVAINYLNCPGFTDTPEELDSLLAFLKAHPIQMIQWRNMNFDPLRYVQTMNKQARHSRPIGMTRVLNDVRQHYPNLRFGYFNPPKEHFAHSKT